MNRFLACLATLFPALALLMLVTQWSVTSTSHSEPLHALQAVAIPPLDPAEALLEIEQLRSQRGSILANSALEQDPELVPPGFVFEYERLCSFPVKQVYAEAPASSTPDLVQQLRQTARLLDEQANAKEDANDYEAETALRNLANQLRLTAKAVQP